MSAEFIVRLLGMVAFGLGGVFWGKDLALSIGGQPTQTAVVLGLVGALAGLVLTPYFTTRPWRALRGALMRVSGRTLWAGLSGLIVGLGLAALLALPFSLLPSPFKEILTFVAVAVFGYFGVLVFVSRQDDLFVVLRSIFGGWREHSERRGDESRVILLDSSVLIDGRVVDIARTGFLSGTLVIPRFVLQEIQYVADSADPLRRQRGRRGLAVVSELQQDPNITVQISDMDVEGVRKVDDKLVVLARQLRCPILTNDYNLNRVAELQGVPVLNINELANAVKALYLPGETLRLKVIQAGKEPDQGVGYLDDGTMVVVEEGRDTIGKEVEVVVTKALQTAAGRMLFARPREKMERPS